MSKAIYVCSLNRPFGPADEDRLKEICKALTPENIVTPVSHRVAVVDRTALCSDELLDIQSREREQPPAGISLRSIRKLEQTAHSLSAVDGNTRSCQLLGELTFISESDNLLGTDGALMI